MAKYRKKPVVIEAIQWFKNGDHPNDECVLITIPDTSNTAGIKTINGIPEKILTEGKVVRYYRRPELDGHTVCKHCLKIMYAHGWIDTLEGGHIVCPGDWVITGVQGEHYPCKPDIFKATYEKVE